MATSKRIETEEIIDPQLFAKNTKDAEAFYQVILKLTQGLKLTHEESLKIAKSNKNPTNAKELNELTAALNTAKVSREGLNAAERIAKKLTDEQAAAIQLETKARRDRINEIKLNTTANQLEEGSIARLRIELQQAQKAYDNLSASKRNAAKGKELETSIAAQTAALNKLEQSTGRFQRNVGNYASGFNGLSTSINQIGRELPNFAIRFETGIQALSNNIPILADEINRVKAANANLQAEGKPTASLFKQIAGAIFSWQTAITVGITAATAFAPKIKEFFTRPTKDAAEAAEDQAKKQKLLNDEIERTLELVDDTRGQRRIEVVENLKNGADASYSSMIDLKDALAAYQNQLDQLRVRRTDMGDFFLVTDEDKNRFELTKKNLQDNINLIEAEIKRRGKQKEKKKKDNNDDLKREQEYLDNLKELVEQYIQIGIDMETDKYEKELRIENENHRKLIEELESYLGKSESITRQANKNIELEQERHFKEIIRIALEAANEQNKITNKLANDEAVRFKNANEVLAKKEKDYKAEQAKKREKEDLEQVQNSLSMLEDVTKALIIELDKRSEREQDAFDRSIDKRKETIDRQKDLAAQGLDNELAFQEAKLAKEELARKEAQEKADREKEIAQLTEAYFNFLNARLSQPGANPLNASALAASDTFLAKGVAKGLVQFALEGNEDVQALPGMKSQKGKDSIPFLLAPGEGVVTEEGNKSNPGVVKALNKGKFDELYMPRMHFDEAVKSVNSSTAENIYNSMLIQQNSEILKTMKKIEAKPVQKVDVDGLKGIITETTYNSGMTTKIYHKLPVRKA